MEKGAKVSSDSVVLKMVGNNSKSTKAKPASATFVFYEGGKPKQLVIENDPELVRVCKKIEFKTTGEWIWTGSKVPGGYGHFGRKGKTVYTHRYMWERFHFPIPDGYDVQHVKDCPADCCPSHLTIGTARSNTQDAIAKGRFGGRGKGISASDKFTILTMLQKGESKNAIAAATNRALSNICYISKKHGHDLPKAIGQCLTDMIDAACYKFKLDIKPAITNLKSEVQ